MRSRPVLGGRDRLALRERGRRATLERNDSEMGCLVEGDRNAGAGDKRAAQPAAELPPRCANGVPPGRMQRPADANEPFVFDELARPLGALAVQQGRIELLAARIVARLF